MTRVMRGVGWSLVTAGLVVLLYLVHATFLTNLQTGRAQAQLREDLGFLPAGGAPAETGGPAARTAPESATGAGEDPRVLGPTSRRPASPDRRSGGEAVDVGDAFAAIWFGRAGSDDPPVRDDPLIVVEGVSLDELRRGPGHYPGTAAPGGEGNVVISGHRTTFGAPFFRLDELRPQDRIHLLDRAHREWVYEVREVQVVPPTALWVTDPDPLGTGEPTLTLTTCHPRFSSSQRLIVFAALVGEDVT